MPAEGGFGEMGRGRLGRGSLDAVMAQLLDDGTRVLSCRDCGTTRAPEPGEVAGFVRSGWPVCCGQTMDFVEAAQLEILSESLLPEPAAVTTPPSTDGSDPTEKMTPDLSASRARPARTPPRTLSRPPAPTRWFQALIGG